MKFARLCRLFLVAAACCCGAAAFMPPDLLERRTEVVQLLPYADVRAVQGWVTELPVELPPAEYLQQLRSRFPAQNSLAWTLYAAVTYLDRLDQTQEAYNDRREALAKARALLVEYEHRVAESLRADYEPANPPSLVLAEPGNQPANVSTEQGLTVFRFLPWPERFSPPERERLLQAAREDIVRAETQAKKIEAARDAFVQRQHRWAAWLLALAEASKNYTTGQYLAPYGDELPLPPSEP